jgi:lysophospholipase L1-like esterase
MYLPRSHGVGYTYAARNWFYYFWHTNELGYRDKPVAEVDRESPKIFVLGDSFTAGHGIRSPSETYAGQLRALIGNQVEVLNLGRNGSDTRDELARLEQFPLEPDLLVMQYFGNDIEVAAAGHGFDFTTSFEPYGDVNVVVKWTLLSSYLLNYAYWLFPHGDTAGYAQTLLRAHLDPAVTSDHFRDLAGIVDFAENRGIPVIVVVFPFLADLSKSESYTQPVGAFFEARGVPVIQVADLVRNVPLRSRVVNSNDSHPSPLVHRLVAERLYDVISEQRWLTLQSSARK